VAIEPAPLALISLSGSWQRTGRFAVVAFRWTLQTRKLPLGWFPPSWAPTATGTGPPFLADLLRARPSPGEALWIVSWGF